jgi:hypothetical protein
LERGWRRDGGDAGGRQEEREECLDAVVFPDVEVDVDGSVAVVRMVA